MSKCNGIHPRNIYKDPLDFKSLVVSYPELLQFTTEKKNGNLNYDFKSRDAVRRLTICLLKRDFGIALVIPDNTLIPTLPLRLNYILWIEDLLESTGRNSNIKGIDIGTGATCIYPLLIARKNKWSMIGIDIDENTLRIAKHNISTNNLSDLVSVRKATSLLDSFNSEEKDFDFCLCNPPFFKSEQHTELPEKKNRASRIIKASMNKAGTPHEVAFPGGEVEFVKKIIQDSIIMQSRVRIYTTMIGCKESLKSITTFMKEKNIEFTESTFTQGRTTRWAVAWSFSSIFLNISSTPLVKKKIKPFVQEIITKYDFEQCVNKINELFKELQVDFESLQKDTKCAGWHFRAYQNTWTGLRKKRRAEKLTKTPNSEETTSTSINDQTEFPENKMKRKIEDVEMSDDVKDAIIKNKIQKVEHTPSFHEQKIVFEAELMINNLQTELESSKGKIKLQIIRIDGLNDAPGQIFYFFKNKLI